MKRTLKQPLPYLDGPILEKVTVTANSANNQYPFSLPIINNLTTIEFPSQVTFFVGENGTGKSTILEALAYKAGFSAEGGSRNIHFKPAQETVYSGPQQLAEQLTLTWRMKPKNGYFFRAESFYNVANYIDSVDAQMFYGGTSLLEQSHGEGFLSFFQTRLNNGGFFIFDEPEAALSAQRQLTLLAIIRQACKNPLTQFIIATHSPLLLAYPDATIYSCDAHMLRTIAYADTQHYQITKNFLDNPDYYLKHLFNELE